ncbi:MAG: hypothetical protein JXB30_04125 [Anaerolineae bacterium]|nr:hypothetical protein [Anaerolineae bacterium]
MPASITANPLFIRLTRRGVSLRTTLWVAVGSMLFSMLAGTASGLASHMLESLSMLLLILIIGTPSFLLNGLYPPVIAVFAAIVVGNDVRSEDYTMLKLTLITPQQVVRGYISASLYRQRMLHAIALGLSFIGLFQNFGLLISNTLSMQYAATSLAPLNAAVSITASLLAVLRIIGLAILASLMGVAFSLLWRQRDPAAVVAAIVMIILQVVGALLSSAGYWFIFFSHLDSDMTTKLIAIFQVGYGVLSVVLVCLLTWGTMCLARRWV